MLFTPPEPTALGAKLLFECAVSKRTQVPETEPGCVQPHCGKDKRRAGLMFVGLGSAGPKYPNSGLLSVR